MKLQARDVTASYGKKEILHGLSFTVRPGEITAILGKNGSGKTTLLRCVSGALAYGGSIRLEGQELRTLRPVERARLLAVMPQMLRDPAVTLRELVSFGRQPYTGLRGVLSPTDRETVERVLAQTGLASLADARLSQVSGGERQKAYFAMLLAQDTPLLLLDEPGAHLDMSYRKQLGELLKREKNAGKTVVVVLHDLNRALELADHVLVLHRGALLLDGTPADLADSDVPGTVFGLARYDCVGPDGAAALPVFR